MFSERLRVSRCVRFLIPMGKALSWFLERLSSSKERQNVISLGMSTSLLLDKSRCTKFSSPKRFGETLLSLLPAKETTVSPGSRLMRSSTSLINSLNLVLRQNQLGQGIGGPPLASFGLEVLEIVDLIGDGGKVAPGVVETARLFSSSKFILEGALNQHL